MLEDEKGKEVRTYADLVPTSRYTDLLINKEEGSKIFLKENSLF